MKANQAPPRAKRGTVTDTYFGEAVDDPYRWLEDWESAEARAWLEAQASHTRAVLDALPDRAKLLARVTELDDAGPSFGDLQRARGRAFYLRRDPGQDVAKLAARVGPDAPERVLVDPNLLPSDTHFAIDWYGPSRDGRHVAYGLSEGGSEDSVLRVVEVESGDVLDVAITRTRWNTIEWLEDNRAFLYIRFPEVAPDAPPADRFINPRLYLHRLGRGAEADEEVLGRGFHPSVDMAPEDFPYIYTSPRSSWMLAAIVHGVLNELTVYVAPRVALGAPAAVPWVKVADVSDGVTGFDLVGDTIYLLTHKGAPRFKVVATPATSPDIATAATIVPESSVVIQATRVAGAYILTRDLDGGLSRLRRVPLSGGEAERIELPFEGTILDWAVEPESPDILLQMTSWTISSRIYRCDAARMTVVDTGWQPPSPVDFSNVVAREVHARSADGTLVPLSIVHRQGIELDGSNPTLLTGYGSYGYSLEPTFRPTMLAWYERGGVYAVAHVRGGGEYGKQWHESGRLLNKQRTIDDFIACAEYLVENGYARPELLAGSGRSAGGVVAGGAIVQRPELWGAIVLLVADTNALRSETSEGGPANIPEFGSVLTEEGFKALRIIDAYAKVEDGVAYPAVLLTTGVNDPRVPPWQAMKMAARLQEATRSDRPVLLRVDFEGGHGMGSTRAQMNEELADQLAFLLWQLRTRARAQS